MCFDLDSTGVPTCTCCALPACPVELLLHSGSLGSLCLAHSFNYHLGANDSQGYISSLDLYFEIQICIFNCLLVSPSSLSQRSFKLNAFNMMPPPESFVLSQCFQLPWGATPLLDVIHRISSASHIWPSPDSIKRSSSHLLKSPPNFHILTHSHSCLCLLFDSAFCCDHFSPRPFNPFPLLPSVVRMHLLKSTVL